MAGLADALTDLRRELVAGADPATAVGEIAHEYKVSPHLLQQTFVRTHGSMEEFARQEPQRRQAVRAGDEAERQRRDAEAEARRQAELEHRRQQDAARQARNVRYWDRLERASMPKPPSKDQYERCCQLATELVGEYFDFSYDRHQATSLSEYQDLLQHAGHAGEAALDAALGRAMERCKISYEFSDGVSKTFRRLFKQSISDWGTTMGYEFGADQMVGRRPVCVDDYIGGAQLGIEIKPPPKRGFPRFAKMIGNSDPQAKRWASGFYRSRIKGFEMGLPYRKTEPVRVIRIAEITSTDEWMNNGMMMTINDRLYMSPKLGDISRVYHSFGGQPVEDSSAIVFETGLLEVFDEIAKDRQNARATFYYFTPPAR